MKKSIIQLSPYPTCLVLRIFLDQKQAQKHLDKDTLATTSLLENNIILVDFDLSPTRAKNKKLVEATAVHESAHVVQLVQKVIDGQLDDESSAYLTQHVYCSIMTQLAKVLRHKH